MQLRSCRRCRNKSECFTLNQKYWLDLAVTGRKLVSETYQLRLHPIYFQYFLLMLRCLIKMRFTAD